jgi:hypothetical protein
MDDADDDAVREVAAALLTAAVLSAKLLAYKAVARRVDEIAEDTGHDLAPVMAQLDRIFGFKDLPALEASLRPALGHTPEADAEPTPKRRGRPRKSRPESDPDEEPRLD